MRNTTEEDVTNLDNYLAIKRERKGGNKSYFEIPKWKKVTNANNKDRECKVQVGRGQMVCFVANC